MSCYQRNKVSAYLHDSSYKTKISSSIIPPPTTALGYHDFLLKALHLSAYTCITQVSVEVCAAV